MTEGTPTPGSGKRPLTKEEIDGILELQAEFDAAGIDPFDPAADRSAEPYDYIAPDESYECKPYACRPVLVAGTGEVASLLIPAESTLLPNDQAWAWKCPHGRTYFLRWEGSVTFEEFKASLNLDEEDEVPNAEA